MQHVFSMIIVCIAKESVYMRIDFHDKMYKIDKKRCGGKYLFISVAKIKIKSYNDYV